MDQLMVNAINAIGGNMRWVHSTERSCINCTRRPDCWPEGSVMDSHPGGFTLRSSWRDRNLSDYFKTIWGGICGNFNHPDIRIQSQFQTTEQRRVSELPQVQKEWED